MRYVLRQGAAHLIYVLGQPKTKGRAGRGAARSGVPRVLCYIPRALQRTDVLPDAADTTRAAPLLP